MANKLNLSAIQRNEYSLSFEKPIVAAHYVHKQKTSMAYDMHYGLEFGIVLSGRMQRQYMNKTLTITPGNVWLCGVWEPHGWRIVRSPCWVVVFILWPDMFSQMCFPENRHFNWMAPFSAPFDMRPTVSPDKQSRMLDLGRQAADKLSGGNANRLWCRTLLMEALLTLTDNWEQRSCQKNIAHDYYVRINNAVTEVFARHDFFTVEAMAKACGMSRNHFSSLFYKVMGVRFPVFSLRHRLGCAMEQLVTSKDPIKSIALTWGFADKAHFHRVFARYFKCSPGHYRRQFI